MDGYGEWNGIIKLVSIFLLWKKSVLPESDSLLYVKGVFNHETPGFSFVFLADFDLNRTANRGSVVLQVQRRLSWKQMSLQDSRPLSRVTE